MYLRKMKGLCFNCLAQDHKVASCLDPTRCWRCHRFSHTSTECRPRSFTQPPSSCPCLNSADASAPPHIARDVGAMIADILLFGHNTSSTTYERRFDSMLHEALLMNQRYDITGGSSTPPLTDLTSQVVSHHPFTEGITTSVLLRSEA
jgi:hypothetical protein